MEVKDHLKAAQDALDADRKKVLDAAAPLHERRAALLKKIQPLEAELRKVNAEIKEAEKPLRAIGNQIAAVARANGARTLKARGTNK
jgi:septal ring factor EnvC (AmiA/AmiB activator)